MFIRQAIQTDIGQLTTISDAEKEFWSYMFDREKVSI